MSRMIRFATIAGLVLIWATTGSVSAQSPNTYTTISVTDITSGAPVVGGLFTTQVHVSISNSGGGTPTAVQGVETYIAFDPGIVNVVDFDNNPTNGTQVEIKTGFFTSVQTGINQVEIPCSTGGSVPGCVHVALSQISGGVTNGSGAIAAIRWVGVAAGTDWA